MCSPVNLDFALVYACSTVSPCHTPACPCHSPLPFPTAVLSTAPVQAAKELSHFTSAEIHWHRVLQGLWGTHSCLGTKSACPSCESGWADAHGETHGGNEGRRLQGTREGMLLTHTSRCPRKH
eukprot:823104-Pelagomonas_calceolata.AAC.1